MRIDSSGVVDIKSGGTAAAPSLILAGDSDTGWYRPTSNTIGFSTAGTERMRIDASGVSTFYGPIISEGPDGGMVMREWPANSAYGMIGTANMVNDEYSLLTNGTDTFIGSGSGGGTYIRGGANDSSPEMLFDGSQVLVKSNGADTLFGIQGNSTGQYDPILNFVASGNPITTEGAQIWYDNSVGDLHISTTYANDAADIHFYTRTGTNKGTNNERLTISGNGKVGIGAPNPAATLHVYNPAGGNATDKASMLSEAVLKLQPHATNSTNLLVAQVNNGNGIGLQVTNGSATANWDLALSPFGGNVGIGTPLPGTKLDVVGDIRSSTRVLINTGATNQNAAIGYWDGSNFRIESGAAQPMLITSYEGNIKLGISGGTTMNITSTSVSAPIFYDSDDTNHYINPNGSVAFSAYQSTLLRRTVPTWTQTAHDIIYNGYATALGDYVYLKAGGNSTTDLGTIVVTDGAGFFIGKSNNATGGVVNSATAPIASVLFRGDNSGNTFATTSSRAPIFYDSNNTAYYVDPNSTSSVVNIAMGGELRLHSHGSTKFYIGGGDAANYTNQNVVLAGWNGLGLYNPTTGGVFPNQTSGFYDFRNGIFDVRGSFRAPIFYDSNNTGYYLNPNGFSYLSLIASDGLSVGRTVISPSGGEYNTATSTQTGAIKVTLPHSWTNTMLRMTIKVYQYSTNQSFEVNCGGYTYAGNGNWINPFAYIIGNPGVDKNFNVRFGHDGTKCCIYIGETNSTWAYAQIVVTDVKLGFSYNTASDWDDGWDVGFATSFGSVSQTLSNSQVGKIADIIYDANDTTYYVNPNSTSYINNLTATRIGVNPSGSSTNRYGISLYGGYNSGEPTYGLLFTGTSGLGTHGAVTGDWATYFTMNNSTTRGWVFRRVGSANVASISGGGTAHFNGDVVAYSSSDERLKDNKKNIENALEKVESLNGIEFDWNDKQDIYTGHDIGVIAQEVEKIAPEIVANREDGYKAVKYEKLVPLLIEAIKELSEKVKILENK
jgi:hypothetical protein